MIQKLCVLFQKFQYILFPSYCVICKKSGPLLCDSCISLLTHNKRPTPSFIISILDYSNPYLHRLMHQFKYNHSKDLGAYLAFKFLYPAINNRFKSRKKVYLIPSPIHEDKLKIRGYNQALVLAEEIAKHMKNAVVLDILHKYNNTNLTRSTHIDDRLNQVNHNYYTLYNIKNEPGATYIIIDDIFTTGSSIYEAKRVLHELGVKNIYAYTLAH